MQLLQTSAGTALQGAGSGDSSTNLSRSVSSAGEHSTGASTPPLPKRADTFSGFESKENHRGKFTVHYHSGFISLMDVLSCILM